MLAPRGAAVTRHLGLAFLPLVLVLASAQPVRAQPMLPATDAQVLTSVLVGDTLFVGGDFTLLGYGTGGAAFVDATTGTVAAGFPDLVGMTFAIADDGSGGWYLGGQFTAVRGQPRQNLAHVLSNGVVDGWNPGANAAVRAIARSAGTIYVAGAFTSVGGIARSRIAAIDGLTGIPTGWNPGANGEVDALAVADTTIYAGGSFTNLGGLPRGCLAAIGAGSGIPTSWNPGANSTVFAVVPVGPTLYVGGGFTTVGGIARASLAALDAATGTPSAWDPGANGSVYSMAVSGSTVYVGGLITSVGGATRNGVAAVDATSGAALPWVADANYPQVNAVALNGSTLYLGGNFTVVGGQPRNYAAAVDAATGAVLSWDPGMGGSNQPFVKAIAVAGANVALGGLFSSANVKPRSRLASIDVVTGQLTSWNPGADNTVTALVAIGNTIYAGGFFLNAGGVPRNKLAAMDAVTGVVNGWSPSIDGYYDQFGHWIPPQVYALTAGANMICVGGRYYGKSLVDPTTGASIAYGCGAGDNAFWVGEVVMDTARTYCARGSNWSMGASWLPPSSNIGWGLTMTGGNAHALLVSGSTLFVGGTFTSLQGDSRNHLANLNSIDGARLPWNPGADGDVLAFARDGRNLYVGGYFSTIAGVPRSMLAALDPATGVAAAWSPVLDNAVTTIQIARGRIIVGGTFGTANGLIAGHLASFPIPDNVAVSLPRGAESIALGPVLPQPMREKASVHFVVPRAGPVSLQLVDLAGRRVRTLVEGVVPAGPQAIDLERGGLPGGIYFLHLRAGGDRSSRTLVVIP